MHSEHSLYMFTGNEEIAVHIQCVTVIVNHYNTYLVHLYQYFNITFDHNNYYQKLLFCLMMKINTIKIKLNDNELDYFVCL